MAKYNLNVNGKKQAVDVEADTPLLWVLRDHLDLKGAKYGCGVAMCGTCTVLINNKAVRSCVMPVAQVGKGKVLTIEGLDKTANHPLQQAWREVDVMQCGYCQSGQIMNAVALLKNKPNPTDGDIDEFMSGNICRCGTYTRIRKAIHLAAKKV